MNWKRFWMILILLPILSPFVFGATLVLNRVTTYSDGTPIPEEKINILHYKYYYGNTKQGSFLEGTLTIDNLVVSIPDPAPGNTVWYTVDSSLDNVSSDKALAQSITTLPPPTGGGTSSPGCAASNFITKI